MSKDPAFLFYSQDFIVGVQTMNFEDRGKYITLLAQMHQQGRLDEETIWFLLGSVSDTIKKKFKIDENGLWYNERLEKEIEKRAGWVNSRRINGKKGGRPSKAYEKPYGKPHEKPYGKASNNHIENENNSIYITSNDSISTTRKKMKKQKIKYSIFYDSQVTQANDPNYEKFVKILFGENSMEEELTSVLSLKKQLSFNQFKNLMSYKQKYKFSFSHILEKMENWKDLTKKHTTVYGSFKVFMNREYQK